MDLTHCWFVQISLQPAALRKGDSRSILPIRSTPSVPLRGAPHERTSSSFPNRTPLAPAPKPTSPNPIRTRPTPPLVPRTPQEPTMRDFLHELSSFKLKPSSSSSLRPPVQSSVRHREVLEGEGEGGEELRGEGEKLPDPTGSVGSVAGSLGSLSSQGWIRSATGTGWIG